MSMEKVHATLRDAGFAVRSLRRSPSFTLIAIVTLGLGIGANTSMFSILSGYAYQPAPYPDADRLERIYRTTPRESRGSVSPADYLEMKPEMVRYGELATYGNADMNLSEPGKPAEMVRALRISANLFSTLGAEPNLGRGFRPDEEIAGNHRVLIISHRYWQTRFAGDAGILGRTVRIDGEVHEIVGVLPEDFSDWRHLSFIDLYRPLGLSEEERADRTSTWLRLVGRRSEDLTRAQAEAFVAGIGRRLAAEFPLENAESGLRTVPILESWIGGGGKTMILMLVGLSAFVLLIACSNLAHLLLARTMARARELAVRGALGASRARLLRPLVIESLLLAFGGGVCAMFVASWMFDWLSVASAGDNGVGVDLALDWRVLSWAFGACVFTALAFGVAPALFARRLDLIAALKSGSRGTTGDRGHRRFRNVLIVAQFALAMVLLAGAALFVRGLHELNHRRYGWESDHLVTGTILLPAAAYPTGREIADFQRLALERLEALPGAASASLSWSVPFFGFAESRKILVEGREAPEAGREPAALLNGVSPRYFETVGTRLLDGRAFAEADSSDSPRVYVVNEAMARGLFADESPIGRRIGLGVGEAFEWGEIVGVAGDVQSVLADPGPVVWQLYQPIAQAPRRRTEIAVRAAGVPPSTLVDGIRTAMMELDPDLPVRALQPAEKTIARANYQLGVLRSMLSALGLLGLGLASLGIYGVISRATVRRTAEFGIRLALGARPGDITRLVLGSGLTLALIGSALGLAGAFGMSRLLAASFPGMQMTSVPVLAGATLLLIGIALAACYMPARHASRISPTETLRAE